MVLKFAPFTALGVAISLFLGFRNNACYDRWWEGRNQWGKQLIVIRNLGRTRGGPMGPGECATWHPRRLHAFWPGTACLARPKDRAT